MKSTLHLSFIRFSDDPALQITGEWNGKTANAHFRWPKLAKAETKTPTPEMSETEGKKIFAALFPAPLRSLLDEAREAHRRELLVRLSIPPRLAEREKLEQIPWEYALDPATDEFLGLSRRLILVRDLGKPDSLPRLEGSPPVRILVAWASPVDSRCGPIDATREVADIRAAWGNKAHVFELPNASFKRFSDRVRELSETDHLHVVHFIGHGASGGGEQAVLAFEKDSSLDLVPAADFATQLEGRPDLRLVVLSACKTAKPPEWVQDPNRSIAYSLLRRGIPAVVATRSNVNGNAAEEFSKAFHGSLARGFGVDDAVAEGRRGLVGSRRGCAKEGLLEWAVPLLYCQAAQAQLFEFEHPEEHAPLKLAVTSAPGFFAPPREVHALKLAEAFVGRALREGYTWDGIRDRIFDFMRSHNWISQEVELRLEAFLSISFAAGFCMGTRGFPITLLHTNRRTGEVESWRLKPRRPDRPETNWRFDPLEGTSSSDLAVAVSISQGNVLQDVKKEWSQLSAGSALILHASIPAGHDAIFDADHAWNLAESLAAKIREVRDGRRVHLFLNGPATFAFYLGQLGGLLGEVQLYEYDSKTTPQYSPSMLVTGRLRPTD